MGGQKLRLFRLSNLSVLNCRLQLFIVNGVKDARRLNGILPIRCIAGLRDVFELGQEQGFSIDRAARDVAEGRQM